MTTEFFKKLSSDITSPSLLENGEDYNVLIEVGPMPNCQIFKAHTIILNSRCSYFRNELVKITYDDENIKKNSHPSIIFDSRQFTDLSKKASVSHLKLDNLQMNEGKFWDNVIRWELLKTPNPLRWSDAKLISLKAMLKNCIPNIRENTVQLHHRILEPEFPKDIMATFMAPNKSISLIILPPRIISATALPPRNISATTSSRKYKLIFGKNIIIDFYNNLYMIINIPSF
ncbi:hypothetical protein C2G38_2202075 [Gigaspora rosea]|uniref:BTB domain-containing protein n=1 Tax=Gigaspora rosea TaxID=44941 RepID=A0A397UP69_9GLOM|nr:hypothetical protein C2G38_2202075 [Gigaspora rosea]